MPRYLNNYWRQIGPVLGGCVPNWLSAAERNGWQKIAAREQTSEGQRVYKVNVWFSQPQSRKESVSLNNNKRLALITSEKCIFPHSSLQCLAEWLFLCAGCFFLFFLHSHLMQPVPRLSFCLRNVYPGEKERLYFRWPTPTHDFSVTFFSNKSPF